MRQIHRLTVNLRSRWPSGKVSPLRPEGSRIETRFLRRSAVYGTCCSPPAGVERKLEEGLPAQALSSSSNSVILTTRLEATRGLFWDGSRNFEARSDDEDDIWAGTPTPNFRNITGGRLATTYDLAYSRPHPRRIFGGIGFRN
ncbi:hypothetical protein AVEN_127942-1 [Araneus ventricosus]|uniref:Uncharacterized protein n=1 Tax=Araneus ventricosus TaxID=182803 RepID=A0A4Y1ZZT7_ARAVE|nr:hypothetical protein AVEN_127942-1 [Araneus ventricosus]